MFVFWSLIFLPLTFPIHSSLGVLLNPEVMMLMNALSLPPKMETLCDLCLFRIWLVIVRLLYWLCDLSLALRIWTHAYNLFFFCTSLYHHVSYHPFYFLQYDLIGVLFLSIWCPAPTMYLPEYICKPLMFVCHYCYPCLLLLSCSLLQFVEYRPVSPSCPRVMRSCQEEVWISHA